MKRSTLWGILSMVLISGVAVFATQDTTWGTIKAAVDSAKPQGNACWGQATRVFAQTGEMGEHSSSFDTPRLGLRNLARALADGGGIPDDSMESLGEFVAVELGVEIDACMD